MMRALHIHSIHVYALAHTYIGGADLGGDESYHKSCQDSWIGGGIALAIRLRPPAQYRHAYLLMDQTQKLTM